MALPSIGGKRKGKGAPIGNKNAAGKHKGGRLKKALLTGAAVGYSGYVIKSRIDASNDRSEARQEAIDAIANRQKAGLDQQNGLASSRTNRY